MKTWVDLQRHERIGLLVRELVRITASITVLLLAYYLLPFDRLSGPGTILLLLVGLIGLAVALVFAVRAILRAEYPALRAVEELAVLIPLFLLLFSTMYYLMGRADPNSFNEPLSRTSSLYFTLTTFSTVGYGDIAAKTDGARIAVMVQIVADVVVVGLGLKALTGAVQEGRQRHRSTDG